MGERFKLEMRGEAYNLANSPHFTNPSGNTGGNISSANFGIITTTLNGYGNRQLQVAARLLF